MKIILGQSYSFFQLGKRTNQEDARYPDSDTPSSNSRLFMVCDGVGGSSHGEIASATVTKTMADSLKHFDWQRPFGIEQFSIAFNAAVQALEDLSTPENDGMSTTLTFAAFHSEGCFVAHVGDSRIYHIRPSVGILYRSDDHSLVNSMVHAGIITPEEVENHPQSNVIVRCVSHDVQNDNVKAATLQIDNIEAGDYFFLCSDGVLHQIDDEVLVNILEKPMSDKDKIKQLADLSTDSSDNNTAILIPVVSIDGKTTVDNEDTENPINDTKTATTQQIERPISSIKEVPAQEPRQKKGIIKRLAILFK